MSFGIAFIVALIICSVKAASMKTAVKKTSAADYMEPGSFHLTKKRDYYLYTTTQRVKGEKMTALLAVAVAAAEARLTAMVLAVEVANSNRQTKTPE